ncbi:hypothetical protein H0H93_016705 [Arthromyces matolae]|nr:hypothetical protein H0H93_016705 [Arthromyces matolae]
MSESHTYHEEKTDLVYDGRFDDEQSSLDDDSEDEESSLVGDWEDEESSLDGDTEDEESSFNGDISSKKSSPNASIDSPRMLRAAEPAPVPMSKVAAITKAIEEITNDTISEDTLRDYRQCVDAFRDFSIDLANNDPGDLDPDLLRKNPDNPNHISRVALALFVSERCLVEGKGYATANKAIAALAWHWDVVENNRYAKDFCYIDGDDQLHGNPARDISIKRLRKAIKRRDEEAEKSHEASSLTHGDLIDIVRESQKRVSDEDVTNFIRCPLNFVAARAAHLVEVRARAFINFGFSLWTLFSGIAEVKGKNIRYVDAPCPHYAICFTEQNDVDLDPSTTYHIYQCSSNPESDCYSHLQTWLSTVRSILKRSLDDEEYLFMKISPLGELHMDKSMSEWRVHKDITRMAEIAGIKKNYDSRSLRRGGAEYCAFDGPSPWPLKELHWWASYSIPKSENPLILMGQVVKGTLARSNCYGDSLNPNKRKYPMIQEPANELTIQHLQHSADTVKDSVENHMKNLALGVNSGFSSFNDRLASIENGLAECFKALGIGKNTGQPYYQSHSNVHISGLSIPPMMQNLTQWTQQSLAQDPYIGIAHDHWMAPDTMPDNLSSPCYRTHDLSASQSTPTPLREVSINAVRIPDLPKERGQWRMAVEQWNVVDPQTKRCLRDWPPDWVDASKAKYDVRKTIATAREMFNAEADFVKAYDADEVTITQLVAKIKEQLKGRKQSRRSKNGSPNTRAAKKAEAAAAAAKVRTRKFGDTRINTSHSSRLDCVESFSCK